MAKPSFELVEILRNTAIRTANSENYQWGHMGSCNCGHLAQEVTSLTKSEIHDYAMRKHGDWNEQVNDYCATSGMPMDLLISEMLNKGLDTEDLKNLEKLSDREVLQLFPLAERNLHQNEKKDVVRYLEKWAELLEKQLTEQIDISDAHPKMKDTAEIYA